MIFIANTLELNGGTTFLLRTCKELSKRGINPTVLVLFGHDASEVATQLSQIARVIPLKKLVLDVLSFVCFRQLGVFLPLANQRIGTLLGEDVKSIHVMGVFGLIVAKRLSKIIGAPPITIGVYHQNEFLFVAAQGYFTRWVKTALSRTPWESLIFFNDSNRVSYAAQFNNDFLKSPVLPIGIELPVIQPNVRLKNNEPHLIVSVGNLVNFKTYNKHVIACLPQLKILYPDVQYEIYGTGDELKTLEKFALEKGVANKVKFCGKVDYAQFAPAVSRATVFVGSGTAILESAILGVPSIVGIESIQDALTYGFISDVKGFSYNEAGLDLPLIPIANVIQRVFEADETELSYISEAGIAKAKQFGVDAMVEGFFASERIAVSQNSISNWELILLCISFGWLTMMDMLGIDRGFRLRRNQSWLA